MYGSGILEAATIRRYTDDLSARIVPARALKRGDYIVDHTKGVSGAAPKDVLQIYEHGHGRRSNPATWPRHIAKVGHKRYPSESVTEHLLTRVGEALELDVARSQLMWVPCAVGRDGRQLRFLSRYFLRDDEHLVHGAEVFSAHFDYPGVTEDLAEAKLEREFLTFQVAEEAIASMFPDERVAIVRNFVRMLAYDAIVGNNDRHHQNWAVISHIRGKRPARFSPIYDTARALCWNMPDRELVTLWSSGEAERNIWLDQYVLRSRPVLGWSGEKRALSHFELIQRVAASSQTHQATLRELADKPLGQDVRRILKTEFRRHIHPIRRVLLMEILSRRYRQYSRVVEG